MHGLVRHYGHTICYRSSPRMMASADNPGASTRCQQLALRSSGARTKSHGNHSHPSPTDCGPAQISRRRSIRIVGSELDPGDLSGDRGMGAELAAVVTGAAGAVQSRSDVGDTRGRQRLSTPLRSARGARACLGPFALAPREARLGRAKQSPRRKVGN